MRFVSTEYFADHELGYWMTSPTDSPPSSTVAGVQTWMREVVAEVIGAAPADIDMDVPFSEYGIDSATALILTDMLGEWLGRDLDPTLLYDHTTISSLATHLAGDE